MSKELFAQAVMGRDAKDFLTSELGRYLLGCCEQERTAALEQLARVSPWRRNRIRQLQNEIWRAESVKTWLAELIVMGGQAESVLEERES
jgi:hypothetical protein